MRKAYVPPFSEVVRLKGESLMEDSFIISFSKTRINQDDINAKQGFFEDFEDEESSGTTNL